MARSRWWLLAAGAAVAAGITASRRRRAGAGNLIAGSSFVTRMTRLAGLGSRVGTTYASNRARRIFASAERREQLDSELEFRTAEQVAAALGNMKGGLMKLGQMASYLDEGLPAPMRAALSQLQQDAPPMSGELAAEVVERELGAPPDRVFAEWDPVPFAAASIGQVHRAITRDDLAVAVKVQYPGVDKAIAADLTTTDLLIQASKMIFPNADSKAVAEEVRARVLEELDYVQEAANQQQFADYYRGHPFIAVPDVLNALSTRRVLTTELAEGARFDELVTWDQDERNLAAEAIDRFVFRSLYRMHCFNGDPHPGNYLFRPGGHVTFLDFGLVKRFTPHETAMFERLIGVIVLHPNPAVLREIMVEERILEHDSPVSANDVMEYLRPFYELILEDREYTWTPEYASEILRRLFDTSQKFTQYASSPSSFVVIQRINLGLYSLFGRLHATANWRRIAEELWPITNRPATTELGRQEAAWLARVPVH